MDHHIADRPTHRTNRQPDSVPKMTDDPATRRRTSVPETVPATTNTTRLPTTATGLTITPETGCVPETHIVPRPDTTTAPHMEQTTGHRTASHTGRLHFDRLTDRIAL